MPLVSFYNFIFNNILFLNNVSKVNLILNSGCIYLQQVKLVHLRLFGAETLKNS